MKIVESNIISGKLEKTTEKLTTEKAMNFYQVDLTCENLLKENNSNLCG